MSILTLLWVGTLCVIYISSYFEVATTNREMLKEHAEHYMLEKPMGGAFDPMKPFPDRGPHFDTNQFKLSTFYSVAISYDNKVIEIRNDDAAVYTDAELESAARQVLEKSDTNGVIDNLVYYRMDKGGYTLVSFMDNTIIRESMNTLFRYTLIFGGVAIVALYFLAVYLAKKIVTPLEESYQKQKQFISDAGHELKTPVSVVSANAELLSREIGDNQWLANIQYENERMGKLVGQLLELARTENVTPQMEYLDLSRLVAGGVLPFESVAFENGLTLNSQIADGIISLGNSTQLSQLVSILVDNAIRHSRNGKEVFISLTHTRSNAVFSVINDGESIPQEQMAQLFERFYRADEARNGEDKHYGLGLAIAKAIVEAHHGKIEVSCYDGKVCFTVQVPKT
ncbi:MAG: HAMP domain-containing histidine kinase [Ruminococcaceae bacterium]|nr:HAMP domain-containing histidine kinase [Oscillospiraceae bacterium]